MNKNIKQKYIEYLNSKAGYETYNRFKNFLYGKNGSLVEKIYTEVIYPYLSKFNGKLFRICDIGGGDGKRILALLLKAHSDFPDLGFELYFVEPSKYAFLKAQKNFIRILNFSKMILINDTFENASLHNGTFNLIFLVHSIYTFSSYQNVTKLLNLKNKGGQILVVANQPESFVSTVNKDSYKDFTEKRYEINNFLKDLKILRIKYAVAIHTTQFFISRRDFPQFAKALITWTSLGRFGKDKTTAKKNREDFLKKLATKKNRVGFNFEETEVFVII